MSQSPTPHSSSAEILAYDKGWAAINRLIRAGRSFSGRERNCCFLNVGSTRFANVSSALELDLPDDGRGLALCDWDGDGRLDFWLTNRTGPRVRFLKNEYATDGGFLALRLTGTHANRDAIGARVEVFRTGSERPLIKTLYGGSGYLSQSTKWLHFGLGDAAGIDRVTVRWPGGTAETFTGFARNGHYLLVENSGQAAPWQPPRPGPWPSHPAAEPALPPSSRVVLLEPAPLPQQLQCRDLAGSRQSLRSPQAGSRGLLINLWATWCTNCLEELSAWTAAQQTLQDAGIDVLAVCVDESSGDVTADAQRVAEVTARLKIPFRVALGDQQLVEILNVFQRAFIGRQSDLPLPSSVLIDAQGRLAVIYKGPISAAQVVADAGLLGQATPQIFDGALPFTGRWLERPPATKARMAAMALVENGYQQAVQDYVRQLLPLYDPSDPTVTLDADALEDRKTEYSSLNHLLGAILFDQQRYDEARQHYETALAASPHNRGLRQELYRTLMRMEQFELAAEQLEAMLEERPDDPEKLAELGRVRLQLGQATKAIELFERAIALKPDAELQFALANALRDNKQYTLAIQQYREVLAAVPSPAVLNNLAWVLATAQDSGARDGAEAVRLALQACQTTSRQVPKMLGTLAAAYAEQGDFDQAARVAGEAIERAAAQDADLAAQLTQRQREYKNHQPTRD